MFLNIVIIFGAFAGVINLGFALLRREYTPVALMRIAMALVCFAVAGGTAYFATSGKPLPATISSLPLIYIFIAVGLFIGATLMLPATIERTMIPPAEQLTPHTTGKLNTDKLTDRSGIRIGTQSEDWVN